MPDIVNAILSPDHPILTPEILLMKLDIDFVRAQFDQLKDDPDFVFASNAGGSYVSSQVNRDNR